MELIDHTGHLYTIPSFDSYPYGYEYETFKYVMWLEDEYVRRLSINEWYIRPVRVLIHQPGPVSVNVNVDSNVFYLIGGKTIQEKVQQTGLNIELDESPDIFKKQLSLDDMHVLEDDTDVLITFYVAGNASEEATWTTNIMINATYEDGKEEWCPITVGGVFRDECEPLIINGHNMGINIPKDIIKALYPNVAGTSIYSNELNEALYNDKVKEYLMNYMKLHGEKGNIDQVRASLKFFQWGSHASISQLIRTDNNIITQYIRDFFNNTNDIARRMEHFVPSSLLSVVVNENQETNKDKPQEYGKKNFWGEMKPIMESLTEKMVYKEYDNTGIKFYKPYYEYVLQELMLKIACLRYYYQKYFLPMHTIILSASLQHQVHANDIKYITKPFVNITEETICAERDRTRQHITFPSFHTLYAYTQQHYVDSNLNEFDNYEEQGHELDDTDIFYIDDICIELPIKFECDDMDLYNCHLVLERKDGTLMMETNFSFSQSKHRYKSLIIYPKLINDWLTMNYWEGKGYCLHLNVNGAWYDYEFTIKVPELHMSFGYLKYKYNNTVHRQINSISENHIDFQSFMYLPSLIDVSNINFPENVVEYGHDGVMEKFIDMYHESPSLPNDGQMTDRYYNRVHYFRLYKNDAELIYKRNEQYDTDADDPDIVNLYKVFFHSNGTQLENVRYKIDSADGLDYDLYLMHDSPDASDYNNVLSNEHMSDIWVPHWYIILISRQTLDNANIENKTAVPTITFMGSNEYTFEHVSSDNKWLINRMVYCDCNGINQFNSDDIIVGTVNNIEFPFILNEGTHWKISTMSPGMEHDSEVTSNTNAFLMSMGGDNTGYDKGYYNITVRYSLDGTTQYQRKHTSRIKVK